MMVGLEADCKELLQNKRLETITLINKSGRLDFFLLPRHQRDSTSLKNYYKEKKWRKTKMGRPRKNNPQNALALLLETGDTQHSAKTSSQQKVLNESSLEWQRHVTRK